MKSDFLVPIILHPATGTKTLTTKGLLDSGCTSSAINKRFVDEHRLETRKTAVPIPVYNADGTRNAGRDITEFAEVRMTIGGHMERINLAITNLGKRDVYLGHDLAEASQPFSQLENTVNPIRMLLVRWQSIHVARCRSQ